MTPTPTVPQTLARLPELAQNLWWSWNAEARDLFRRLDPPLWRLTRHNPVRLLQEITPERLNDAALDLEIRRLYDDVLAAFDRALAGPSTWCSDSHAELSRGLVGFFSAEYGLHSTLPLYAGGLGVLAGDIAKEASDLGLPMVGIGFMYPQGYFRQRINVEGRQEEIYEMIDRERVPVERVLTQDGSLLMIDLSLPDRVLHVAAWRVRLGRTTLYLLDTDIDGNAPWDRELTGRLYGGDQSVRVLQEIVLGLAGVRLLRAIGLSPTVWHGNEGHTAFMMLERLRERLEAGLEFEAALSDVRATTIFTTHTPVAAGHDAFPYAMVESHLATIEGFGSWLDPLRSRLLDLGVYEGAFNMTVLAMHLAGRVNGVSRRHGEVSRQMWRPLWPGVADDDIPIRSITNGVHVPTWIAPEMDRLFRRRLAEDWLARHDDPEIWARAAALTDDALWETRRALKANLHSFLRERIRYRWAEERVEPGQTVAFGALLDPEAFTIGFARRFATYKRADLILRDPARLKRLLRDGRRPVQLIFAGKAHPADEHGKSLLQSVYRAARDPELAGRIAFLEDYDMHSAHWLVSGVDLWLNSPRAPLEASGTSGMKAGLNGVPSLSILDGWWEEGHDGGNGWAFGAVKSGGSADAGPDQAALDAADAESLYRMLEDTVVPLYFQRNSDGMPHGWLRVVRRAIQTVTPAFSARRMMKEYVERMYVPASEQALDESLRTTP
ncbi:MAG TPA: alpha-glucan family phosphorylase [Candidatus Eisenbacteria bacterium]|nr:alpha-glucan family phosphorylase [Candidatus Eisenbacteria bacterium]